MPKIDTVLARYVEALGGKAALQKVTSRVVKGEGESAMLPAPAPWQFFAKAPNKRLSVLTVAGFGDVLDGFDGMHGWMKNPTCLPPSAAVRNSPRSGAMRISTAT